MQKSIWKEASDYVTRSRRRAVWTRIVSVLACVVVFCTTYALILPALTLEQPKTLVCTYETLGVHQHTADCYDAEGNLICGYADFVVHTHDERCYDADGNLVCALPEIQPHTHNETCFEEASVLSCGLEESEGHIHTDECYQDVYDEDGNPAGRELLCGQEESEGHTHTDACYSLQLTQLCEQEEIKLHTHTEDCYDADGALICGQLEIVEHIHTDACFVAAEAEETGAPYTYIDDTLAAEVTLAGDASLPEGAALTVQPIPSASLTVQPTPGASLYSLDGAQEDSYEDLVYQAEEALGQSAAGIVFYDISFYDSDGAYLSVQTPATVSLRFQEAVFPEGTEHVAVLHYAADGTLPEVLENVTVERDEETGEISAVTFETDGFSNFGIMPLADPDTDTADSSSSFTLTYTYNGTEYKITFNIEDGNGNAIPGDYSKYNFSATDATLYKFSNIAPKIDGYAFARATYNINNNNNPVVSVSTNGYDNGTGAHNYLFQFYINDPIVSSQWYSRDENSSTNFTVTLTYAQELDSALINHPFALFNPANKMVMLASSNNNGTNKLDAQLFTHTVTQNQEDGYYSVTTHSQDLAASVREVLLWTFEEVPDLENRYYLTTTTADGTKQYVKISGSDVTLVGNPDTDCVLTVTEGTGTYAGQVRLTNSSGRAINKYGGQSYFGGYSDNSANEYFYLVDLNQLAMPGTVEGVTPAGTVINLFDYWAFNNGPQYDTSGNLIGGDYSEGNQRGNGINDGHFLKFTRNQTPGTNQLTGANMWTGTVAPYSGIVQNTLGSGDSPVLTEGLTDNMGTTDDETDDVTSTAESLAYLFDPDTQYDYDPDTNNGNYRTTYRNVGNLLQVDSQGYYYYDSQENFAELNPATNQFTLYETGGVKPGGADPNLKGQFFPFDSLEKVIDQSSASDYVNHYFGLTMTTRFVHRHDGFTGADRQTPVIFEFAGDDDVWIFVDDVLVADLGGIHDRASVKIDFSTGSIVINEGKTDKNGKNLQQSSTLYNMFVTAGKANSVTWRADENEDGTTTYSTFENDTYHLLQFFYLERGNVDSNLHLKYNLASYPPTGITKVNQYGEAVYGAEFKVYKADKDYKIIDPAPAYTGTTDATGKMVFVDEDNMPYTMDDLERMFGQYFVLKETVVPSGYRLVNDEIHLHISSNVLLCENTWDSGVWADTNLLVSAPNTITLVNGNTVDAANYGKIFAVVLKYTGPRNPDTNAATGLTDENNWAPLYGTAATGFVVLDADARTNGDSSIESDPFRGGTFIEAAIYAARHYVESQNVFAIGSSGALEGIINGMPGDVSKYYYMLKDKSQTEYTVAYYWTSANRLEDATDSNTFRIDADDSDYPFDRVFGATINVPNLVNDLYAQKFSEDGERVNGATFALYKVEEDAGTPGTIYYLADDGARFSLTEVQYTIDADGTINIKDANGNVTNTITPYKVETAMTAGNTDNKTNEDGTAIFSYVEAGTYYLREIAAPSGYELNETEVLVYVTANALYANAGTENDGITVARGPGYIAHPLNQFASIGDVNNTLSWVYERMRITGESHTFTAFNDTGDGWAYLAANKTGTTVAAGQEPYTVHLIYNNDETNELFNFKVNEDWYKKENYTDAQIAALTRRLYTTVGWSYYELYQDYSETHIKDAESRNAIYENLSGKEIANLFSRAIFVQFTDPYANGNLEISKTVVPVTTTSFQFTLSLTDPEASTTALAGTYDYQIYTVTYDEDGKEVRTSDSDTMGQITNGTASFTLTNGQVIVIENLPYGAGYTIKETVGTGTSTFGYTPQVSTNGAAAVEGAETTGTLKWRADHRADTGENVCTIQYTNALLPLVKVKKEDSLTNKPLAGASFVLYYKDETNAKKYYHRGEFKALIDDQSEATYARETPASGELLFASLEPGKTYYLKEISAPAGYIPLDREIQINVDNDGKITVQNNGGTGYEVTGTDHEGQELDLTVQNTPSFELPETGGTGTFSYTAAGTLLIVGSLLCGYIPARSRKKRSAQSHTPL